MRIAVVVSLYAPSMSSLSIFLDTLVFTVKVRLGNLYYTGEPIASGYYKGTQKDKYRTENEKVKKCK